MYTEQEAQDAINHAMDADLANIRPQARIMRIRTRIETLEILSDMEKLEALPF